MISKGIVFNGIHSYKDLNLILTEVKIPPAAVRNVFVDIPGRDGSVDLTEANGNVRYADRECTFTFVIHPRDDYEVKKTEVSNALSGARCKIILDADPKYYYFGRCWVNEYLSSERIHRIVIAARVNPYKFKKDITQITVSAGDQHEVTLVNRRKPVIPTITNSAETTIEFHGTTYKFTEGTHQNLDLQLVQGDNILVVSSAEDVVFTYQEGDL